MKQQYKELRLRGATLELIDKANTIIEDYQSQGFVLTLRQLYYQLVTQNVLENTEKNYKKLSVVMNSARDAGLVDWDSIEDRTRTFRQQGHWSSPKAVLDACVSQYAVDMWADQDFRVYCIVEKDALVGVLGRVCKTWDLPLLAARGYPSASVIREFANERVQGYSDAGQRIAILHLGDHDPSGLDMTRDLEERIALYSGQVPFVLDRLALNMDQIEAQKPPPNPAKEDDSRFVEYRRKHGSMSWELDALKPNYIESLVANAVKPYVDMEKWDAKKAEVEAAKTKLRSLTQYL